jgi:hypothetical protein
MLRRRISAACASVGALESGFTVEPCATINNAASRVRFTLEFYHGEHGGYRKEILSVTSALRVFNTFVRFRTYKNTDLTVSEVGFGLWTISTGWWGNFTEGEATALM